ncbi:MAG: 3-ketoacyl-ACP reductase [Qingshengfaniella sp.]
MIRPLACVTGCNRGLGRGISAALAIGGFDIIGVDRARTEDTRHTRGLVEQAGGQMRFVSCDIADTAAVVGLEAQLADRGPVHCLVNNAGVQTRERVSLLDLTPDEFDRVLSVNLRGTFFLTQKIAGLMRADPPNPDLGVRSIITVTSSAAQAANPQTAAYCLSKSALSMMVRLFALELAGDGIASYELRPGLIRTPMTGPDLRPYEAMFSSGRVPAGDWGSIEQIGTAVATLARGGLPYCTGEVVNISGGFQIEQIG